MDKEQIKKIIDSPPEYDESKENTLRVWLRDGHSKRMLWVAIGVYTQYAILLALIIFSAVKFFRAEQTGAQILYAAIFICCSHWMGFISVFGWVMMQRPHNDREINRLELRIAELSETVKNK